MADTATREDVSRLFARAGFGASAADLDRWGDGTRAYEEVVSSLVDIPSPASRPPLPDEARRIAIELAGRYSDVPLPRQIPVSPAQAQRWWLDRMRTTPYPLEERMVLFWHDHFATAFGGPFPDTGMMMLQNQTLRRHALGSFREMCVAITLDPAMLYWLNGVENRRGKPNENFAREFFELFSLGTIPQVYSDSQATPNDISEAARVFTGWTVDPVTRIPVFTAGRHDIGRKVVLGREIGNLGNREYLEVVDVALDQQVSAFFVAYKIVQSFAYLPTTRDLLGEPDPLVTTVALRLQETDWDLREGMRALLLAPGFRYADPSQEQQIVRQPIDLVAAAGRALRISLDTPQAIDVLARMGQLPFDPPNVGGWPAGRNWLSPVTMLARYDWGVHCYNLWAAAPQPFRASLPASADLAGWAALFGLAGLSANTASAITDYLVARHAQPESEKQAGVLALIASSPDWMVM